MEPLKIRRVRKSADMTRNIVNKTLTHDLVRELSLGDISKRQTYKSHDPMLPECYVTPV